MNTQNADMYSYSNSPATGGAPRDGEAPAGTGLLNTLAGVVNASVSGRAEAVPSDIAYTAGSIYGAPALGAAAPAEAAALGAAKNPGMPEQLASPIQDTTPKPREPYSATAADGWFALLFLALGVLFYRVTLHQGEWMGWGVTLFVVLYAVLVLGYAYAKQVKPARGSWFWLAVGLVCGASYALWPAGSLIYTRSLFLFAVLLYWCGCVFGVLLQGKTGNFILLDALNLYFVVPLRNWLLGLRSVKWLVARRVKGGEKAARNGKIVGSVLLGVGLCIPFLAIALPMLLAADSGGFEILLDNTLQSLERFFENLKWQDFWSVIGGLLAGCYLFGLATGSAHKRYVKQLEAKRAEKTLLGLRVLPGASSMAVLCVVAALYLLFIFSQLPYYFAAFGGELPEGYVNYSVYARQGFFELCRLAGINLGLLLAANCFCRQKTREFLPLRIANLVMVAVNLVFLATAFSKMALYIAAHGLTPKRVLTSVFMVFLAGVWGAVAVLQFRRFSILRFAALLGSAMFCALCISNVDGIIIRYNANRYLDGTLETFETVLLENPGLGGRTAVWEVYTGTSDKELAGKLVGWMAEMDLRGHAVEGTRQDNLAMADWRSDPHGLFVNQGQEAENE